MSNLLGGAQLFELSPEHVEDGQRIGFLHEDKAAALGRLMAVDGQRDPIKVVANPKNAERPWRLVTGMHRLVGARIEGITVWGIEVKGKPEDLADLEASENLHRRPLAPIERSKFVHALCKAAQERIAREHGELSQQKLGMKVRWSRVKAGEIRVDQALQEEGDDTADKMSAVYGWQESAADAFGLDKRTIRRALELYHLIIEPFPDLVADLAAHPVVGENASQLKLIAEIRDEAKRRQVIEALIVDPELSADDARVQAGIGMLGKAGAATPLPYQKHYDAISGGWARLGVAEQRQFLPNIAAMLPPSMKRDLRDKLNAELGEPAPDAAVLKPAVAIRQSVKPDYLVCLEDGTRHVNLTPWIRRLGMTAAEYRDRWSLPRDYPMVAPNHSNDRRQHLTKLVRKIAAKRKALEAADA
jgi:predicted transcriptional regulator